MLMTGVDISRVIFVPFGLGESSIQRIFPYKIVIRSEGGSDVVESNTFHGFI